MSKETISHQDFRHFYLAKSYDVIGQGGFRRHLCKCKEVGDPWAMEMNAGAVKVQSGIRGLQSAVQQIPRPHNAMLHQLCKEVMVAAQPPIRMYAGYTTCCLSGLHCNTCIDLTRPAKNAQYVHVHARFSHFFLMLWYCSKLEYVVRSCAKAWLERQDVRAESNFKDMCEAFTAETKDFCDSLYNIFVISQSHLHKTMHILNQSICQKVLDIGPATIKDPAPDVSIKTALDAGVVQRLEQDPNSPH